MTVRLQSEQFGCPEAFCTNGSFDFVTILIEELTQTKVAKEELTLVIQHDVVRLDVSMSNVQDFMAVMKCRNQLLEVDSDFLLVKSTCTLAQLFSKCSTGQEVHDKVNVLGVAVVDDLMEFDNV